MFNSTFTLPPPDVAEAAITYPEGSCDENPFILAGEAAHRFRSLLIVLYGTYVL